MVKRKRRGEMIPTERIGSVVHMMTVHAGCKFTTADIARYAEISHAGAWAMLTRLSRKVPLACDADGWYIVPSTDS